MGIMQEAHELARSLVKQRVDVNEVESVLSYARCKRDLSATLDVIHRLATQEDHAYSKRTHTYHQAIHRQVTPVLRRVSDVEEGLKLLGWLVRYMRYEKTKARAQRRGYR